MNNALLVKLNKLTFFSLTQTQQLTYTLLFFCLLSYAIFNFFCKPLYEKQSTLRTYHSQLVQQELTLQHAQQDSNMSSTDKLFSFEFDSKKDPVPLTSQITTLLKESDIGLIWLQQNRRHSEFFQQIEQTQLELLGDYFQLKQLIAMLLQQEQGISTLSEIKLQSHQNQLKLTLIIDTYQHEVFL